MTFDFDQVHDRLSTNSLKWTRYSREILPLWVADMDFPAPEPARQALRQAIEHGIFGYEMPTRKLQETVANRMARLYNWQVSPEMVVATPGIVSGFSAAARAVCQPGEGILMQPPVYHPFLETPANSGTIRQLAPLRPVHDLSLLRYDIDWAALEGAVNSSGARTAMFLLCHPHNPTGQVYTPAELKRLAEICIKNQVILCSDEIHSELLLGGANHVPLASLDPEIARNSITLVSPSKTFNLVGLFCGFAIIPDSRLRLRYRQVLEKMTLHVNSLGLVAAQAGFSGACDSWLEALRQYLTANRDFVVNFVSRELKPVRVTNPDATYLAWLDFSEWVSQRHLGTDPYHFLLDKAQVALNPGPDFGSGGEHCARLNFGCPRATLVEALQRIKKAIL